MARTLGELGEFQALARLLPVTERYGPLGDDCFFLPWRDGFLVATADPGPIPLISQLGPEWRDLAIWGWYAAAASASDLATSGAEALFMTNCLAAPNATPEDEVRAYFRGYSEALEHFGFANGGGDLSSAEEFRSVCTAVGWVTGDPIRRNGCSPGDILACVGRSGAFAAAFLSAIAHARDELSPETITTLSRPIPRLREMRTLHQECTVTAASDASDGLMGAIWNIAERSRCAFVLELSSQQRLKVVDDAASAFGLDPWSLYFFWGDWQVAITFRESDLHAITRLAEEHDIELTVLGRAIDGNPRLTATVDGLRCSVNLIRNEHFSPDTYLGKEPRDVTEFLRRPVIDNFRA